MRSYLDFEKPVAELEAKVEELRAVGETGSAAVGDEISRLEAKAALALRDLYADLTPWQKTQVARHPQRPHCLDTIAGLIANFIPLAGDRKFGEDPAIVGEKHVAVASRAGCHRGDRSLVRCTAQGSEEVCVSEGKDPAVRRSHPITIA